MEAEAAADAHSRHTVTMLSQRGKPCKYIHGQLSSFKWQLFEIQLRTSLNFIHARPEHIGIEYAMDGCVVYACVNLIFSSNIYPSVCSGTTTAFRTAIEDIPRIHETTSGPVPNQAQFLMIFKFLESAAVHGRFFCLGPKLLSIRDQSIFLPLKQQP
jgi:hypothetical protein